MVATSELQREKKKGREGWEFGSELAINLINYQKRGWKITSADTKGVAMAVKVL